MLNAVRKFRRWLWNWLYALDLFINAIFGGDPQHTISLRAARAEVDHTGWKRWLGRAMCRFLDLFQPGHCASCIEDYMDGGRA